MLKTLLKMFNENLMFKLYITKHIISKKQLLQKSIIHSKKRMLNFHNIMKISKFQIQTAALFFLK